MTREGIEIEFDEKHGYLHLACERDAFAPYREIARGQLKDIPDVAVDKAIEIRIVDTARFVARRDAPKRRMINMVVGLVLALVLGLAVIGACAIIGKVVR